MKSPKDLKHKLRRQWENADYRQSRLASDVDSVWPVVLTIGRPSAKSIVSDFDAVRKHIQNWRQINVGTVVWEPARYRATAQAIEVPVQWQITGPQEWLTACGDRRMQEEFAAIDSIVQQADVLFHSLLIRRRSLWNSKPLDEVIQAVRLAMLLNPGCAEGRPLRTLSIEGIDTKFFERHATLITSLLDVRFDGDVSHMGLETFLGALSEGEHWLLVVDLDGSLLPFDKQRIRSSELSTTELPGTRLLIVENESCQHQLPQVPGTIAVLGAGFDLTWTCAHWLKEKPIGYWGDIDTWGLLFLAVARENMPQVEGLLMSEEAYEAQQHSSVFEPVVAGQEVPSALTPSEKTLYCRLLNEPRGRLEQEFLPETTIQDAILRWAANS